MTQDHLAPHTGALERRRIKLGIVAGFLALVADQGYLVPFLGLRPEYDTLAGTGLPFIVVGFFLGLVGMPLYLAGHWQIYRVLEPRGGMLPRIYWLASFAGSITVLVAHSTIGITTLHEVLVWRHATTSPTSTLAWAYLIHPLYLIAGTSFLVASVAFARLVWRKESPYPRWLAPANPITLFVLVNVLTLSPKVVHDAVNPSSVHFAMLVFFVLVATTSRRRTSR